MNNIIINYLNSVPGLDAIIDEIVNNINNEEIRALKQEIQILLQ